MPREVELDRGGDPLTPVASEYRVTNAACDRQVIPQRLRKHPSNPQRQLMPFLTDLDERAEVKGSRDPLGLVPLWSKLGREVVGNLTTVTTSVRGFTTVLVGLEIAEIIRDHLRGEAPPAIDVFLRVEQLAGYARY